MGERGIPKQLRNPVFHTEGEQNGNDEITLNRYGNVRVVKIRAAFNDLRKAIRSGDIEAANHALDRYEPWADYIFSEGALALPLEGQE